MIITSCYILFNKNRDAGSVRGITLFAFHLSRGKYPAMVQSLQWYKCPLTNSGVCWYLSLFWGTLK